MVAPSIMERPVFQAAAANTQTTSKAELYRELELQLGGMLAGERDKIANAANMAALLFDWLPDVNWVGFYFIDSSGNGLVVGPFQGKPACVRIAIGRGVCGTAAAERRSILVPDVHEFPGHIACDAASQSELVVPLLKDGRTVGVFDLDSPSLRRFDAEDQAGIESLVRIYLEGSEI
jgi:L-methionine (R)-S-oxide reductase